MRQPIEVVCEAARTKARREYQHQTSIENDATSTSEASRLCEGVVAPTARQRAGAPTVRLDLLHILAPIHRSENKYKGKKGPSNIRPCPATRRSGRRVFWLMGSAQKTAAMDPTHPL